MFDLRDSADFYRVLVEDFDEFMSDPHSTRRAIHCTLIAYHLREWVWHDWLKDDLAVKTALGIHDQRSFKEWTNQKCIWFSSVRNLANGSKHFAVEAEFQTLRVTAAPFAFDQPTAGLDQGAWDSPIRGSQNDCPVGPAGKGYLLIDYGEGAGEHRWQPAAHLLEVVVRFWRDFFRTYRPAPDLPISKYHVD